MIGIPAGKAIGIRRRYAADAGLSERRRIRQSAPAALDTPELIPYNHAPDFTGPLRVSGTVYPRE